MVKEILVNVELLLRLHIVNSCCRRDVSTTLAHRKPLLQSTGPCTENPCYSRGVSATLTHRKYLMLSRNKKCCKPTLALHLCTENICWRRNVSTTCAHKKISADALSLSYSYIAEVLFDHYQFSGHAKGCTLIKLFEWTGD